MPANRLEKHQEDYKEDAWKTYTIYELGWWVHLFSERAVHRQKTEKATRDLYNAKNYLWMMEQKLRNKAEKLSINFDEL